MAVVDSTLENDTKSLVNTTQRRIPVTNNVFVEEQQRLKAYVSASSIMSQWARSQLGGTKGTGSTRVNTSKFIHWLAAFCFWTSVPWVSQKALKRERVNTEFINVEGSFQKRKWNKKMLSQHSMQFLTYYILHQSCIIINIVSSTFFFLYWNLVYSIE